MGGRHDAECAALRRVRGEGRALPTPVRGGVHVLRRFGEGGVRERVQGMVGWREEQMRGEGVRVQAKGVVHYAGLEMDGGNLEDAVGLLCAVSWVGSLLPAFLCSP